MKLEKQMAIYRVMAKHLDRRKFFGWFLVLAVPFSIVWLLFIDRVGPANSPPRMIVSFVGCLVIFNVVYFKAFRPAMMKAQEEVEQRE